MKKIVITGPESTGKSTLSIALSKELNLPFLEEYARVYLEKNGPSYSFDDVLKMASEQLRLEKDLVRSNPNNGIILDTDLTVYHVWIKEKYQKDLDWINKSICEGKDKIYFLCDIDLEWTFDPLREHPNLDDRKRLFQCYANLLEINNLNYHILSGNEEERLKKALEIISSLK